MNWFYELLPSVPEVLLALLIIWYVHPSEEGWVLRLLQVFTLLFTFTAIYLAILHPRTP